MYAIILISLLIYYKFIFLFNTGTPFTHYLQTLLATKSVCFILTPILFSYTFSSMTWQRKLIHDLIFETHFTLVKSSTITYLSLAAQIMILTEVKSATLKMKPKALPSWSLLVYALKCTRSPYVVLPSTNKDLTATLKCTTNTSQKAFRDHKSRGLRMRITSICTMVER